MPDPSLTEPMQQRVRQFCEEIAGHNGLPDEVREELETYFQDRMLGYLTREDVPTEEEAFILAREHFGDEQLVKDLLLNVHEDRPLSRMSRWFYAGAGLAFAGYIWPGYIWPTIAGKLPNLWINALASLHQITYFLFCFALSIGFLIVALVLNWRRNKESLDNLFGWYFLVLVAGGIVTTVPYLFSLFARGRTVFLLWFLLLNIVYAIVATGFFRRAWWTKWAVLAVLVLTLAYDWKLGLSYGGPPATASAISPAQPLAGSIPVQMVAVTIPPNWYVQSLYLLTLIHCFSPARSRHTSPATSRAPVAG